MVFDVGALLERELETLTPLLRSKATKNVWSFTVSAEIAGHPWDRSFKSRTFDSGYALALVLVFKLRHWNLDPAIAVTSVRTHAASPSGKSRTIL